MNEVWPCMYSPADLPSSTRAAPAKKRIWSHIGGISSDAVSSRGLPVFCDSTATSSSARSSIASAIRSSARWRSLGVESRHVSNAVAADWNAASMSAWPDTGALANTSPVVGSTSSAVRPSAAATRAPLMKLVISVVCVLIASPLSGSLDGPAARRAPGCGRRSRPA